MILNTRLILGVLSMAVAASSLTGCSEKPADTPEVAQVETMMPESQIEEAEVDITEMADTSSAQPSSGEYLPAPGGRFTAPYNQALQAAGDDGLVMLAEVSHAAGINMAQQGNDAGYDYVLQAAEILRKAVAKGALVSPDLLGTTFYNEACALSLRGDPAGSLTALERAIESGFDDVALIKSDSDLDNLRATDGFAAKLADFEARITAIMLEHVREEIANSNSYPFDFALTSFGGEELSLDSYQGKVLIVDFWGTWCPPCRAEIPSFVKLQEAYGEQGLQIVGLNYESGTEEAIAKKVNSFIEENGINYPCAPGTEEIREQVPKFQGYPTTLFIDRTGKVRMTTVGLHPYAYLEAVVKILLEDSAG